MRTLTEKYLGGLRLDEDIYKVDLAVLDRYQAFSGELLRLSLLGIAGYGFLITNVFLKSNGGSSGFVTQVPRYVMNIALPAGAVVLALSAMTALGHRYFSTDCITHYVRRIRLFKKQDGLPEDDPQREIVAKIIVVEEMSLEKDLKRCKWLLTSSSIFLLLGAACVAWAFAATLSALSDG
jgi:hypothetical protein